MTELERRADDFVARHESIKKGDTVIVALSGGADSMALFHFLLLRRRAWGFRLLAAHVDHGLRAASGRDAAFAARQCAAADVPLACKKLTPPPGAGEAWARKERYAFLEELAAQYGAKVATAHTRDDQAETVLLNLARGAAARGAAGIPPVRGPFFRPLLDVTRDEVLAFLAQYGVPHVEDETNAGDAYARNRARHNLLPLLEEVHPGAGAALARFAQSMAETADFLDAEARAALDGACLGPGEYDAAALAALPPAVGKTAAALLLRGLGPPEKAALTDDVYGCLKTGGAVTVGENAECRVSQGRLRVGPRRLPAAPDWQRPLAAGEFRAPDGCVVTVQVLAYEDFAKCQENVKKGLNFAADYDKISGNTQFRTRRAGDVFRPAGRGVAKPLRKWQSECRVAPACRALTPLLARGSEILWTPQQGFAQGLAPTNKTRAVALIGARRDGGT